MHPAVQNLSADGILRCYYTLSAAGTPRKGGGWVHVLQPGARRHTAVISTPGAGCAAEQICSRAVVTWCFCSNRKRCKWLATRALSAIADWYAELAVCSFASPCRHPLTNECTDPRLSMTAVRVPCQQPCAQASQHSTMILTCNNVSRGVDDSAPHPVQAWLLVMHLQGPRRTCSTVTAAAL
jgi:hypothetical protein